MLGAELALPRGGGPGEGQKKPPADGRGFGVGYLSLLFASRATFVAWVPPGTAPKSCLGFSASICSRRVLISAAAALSMAARSSQSFTLPAPPSRRRHDRKPASPTLGRAGGSDYPSFSAEDRLLLVENPSSNLNEGPLLLGRPARAASVSVVFPSSQKRRAGQGPSLLAHTHSHNSITPGFKSPRHIRQVCNKDQPYSPSLPLLPSAPATVTVLLGRSFPS